MQANNRYIWNTILAYGTLILHTWPKLVTWDMGYFAKIVIHSWYMAHQFYIRDCTWEKPAMWYILQKPWSRIILTLLPLLKVRDRLPVPFLRCSDRRTMMCKVLKSEVTVYIRVATHAVEPLCILWVSINWFWVGLLNLTNKRTRNNEDIQAQHLVEHLKRRRLTSIGQQSFVGN